MTESDNRDEPTIKRRWIIIQQAGSAPEKKSPKQSHEGVIEVLRELAEIYPCATLTVAELTHDDDLWVQSEREALSMADFVEGSLFIPLKREYFNA